MMNEMTKEIIDYSEMMTTQDSLVLQNLAEETNLSQPAHFMMSSHLQGQFLKMLASLTGAKRVLEVGMFTGYTALSMAEALPVDGEITCLEIDEKIVPFAQKYFNKSPHGHKISVKVGPAAEEIAKLTGEFDLVFVDADKQGYPSYFEAVFPKVKSGGLIVLDNMFYGGDVLAPKGESAKVLDQLNRQLAEDDRVEVVLLPIRDGLSLVRKKG